VRALIIGVDSTIGRALSIAFASAGIAWSGTSRRSLHPPDMLPPDMLPLDLCTLAGLDALPDADTIYLCAAMTREVECRANPALSRQINVEAPVALTRMFRARGAHIVFLSSNAVFDGSKPGRREGEPPSPTTPYGSGKVEAEHRILEQGGAAALRLTKVLNPEQPLLRGWIASLSAGEVVRPIHDMPVAPLTLGHVTAALRALGEARAEGIFHQSAARDVAYADIAYHFAARLGAARALVQPQSRAEAGILETDWGANTCLSTERLTGLTGFRPPDPFDVLDRVYGLAPTDA